MQAPIKRSIRESCKVFTQEQADTFTPSITPEALPYILSSVVLLDEEERPLDGVREPRVIKKYYINIEDGVQEIYQGAYIYPYWGKGTMFAHVEIVFDEVPVPHESILKWCSLALKAGPVSSSARANQLVVTKGNRLHYLWRVISIEAENALAPSRSLDITGLHLWRWHSAESHTPSLGSKPLASRPLVSAVGHDPWGGVSDPNRWVCGRVSLAIERNELLGVLEYTLTTSRGSRLIDWAQHTVHVEDTEVVHQLYMSLLAENLL